jgi:hypothetical protein
LDLLPEHRALREGVGVEEAADYISVVMAPDL